MRIRYGTDIDPCSIGLHNDTYPIFNTLPFIVEDLGNMVAYKDYFTDRKGFDMYLLFVTISGSGIIKYRNKEVKLKENQLAFIYCNEDQYYATSEDGNWNFKWAHIRGIAVQEYFTLINGSSFNIIESKPVAEFVSSKIDEITQIIKNKDEKADLYISNIVSSILTHLVTAVNVDEVEFLQKNTRSQDIEKVLSYIDENLSSSMSVDELAKIACMSRYHFFRTFKNCTGKCPYEYIQARKINESLKYLRFENITIQEVSNKIGYSNVNNFIKDFKKIIGTTPNKYRLSYKSQKP